MGRRCFVETFGAHFPADDLALHLDRMFGPDGLPAELADPAVRVRHGRGGRRDRRLSEARADEPAGRRIEPGALEIKQLYVLAPWQGAGVAAALMDWAIETGARRMAPRPCTSASGRRATAPSPSMRRQGFVTVGDAPFRLGTRVYQDPVMRLDL